MSRRGTECLVVAVLALCGATVSAAGEWRQMAAAADAGGNLSSNLVRFEEGEYRHVCAAGQPGTVGTASGGRWRLYAGLLQAADVKQPALDTDADGTPDELDSDNDGDGLDDGVEVDGSAFDGQAATDPNNPDSDDDGMSDRAESDGMYDPLDPNHRLAIVAIAHRDGETVVRWVGKGGGTTNILWTGKQPDVTDERVHAAAYSGGVPPWYKATHEHAWPDAAASRYLRVTTGTAP